MQHNRVFIQVSSGVNLVIEAGAGTGKTTELINRLCTCVLVQGIVVEKLVALTFTDKAAAEIKLRFVAKLQSVIAQLRKEKALREAGAEIGPCPEKTLSFLRTYFVVKEEDLLARAEAALAHLNRASIGTIHSFCAEILKLFPLEAGLSPQAAIDNGTQTKQLFEARWNRFLDEQLGDAAKNPQAWKTVLREISLEDLKKFAMELCSGKIEQYNYLAAREEVCALCRRYEERARELATCFLINPKNPQKPKKPRKIEEKLSFSADSLRRSLAFLQGRAYGPLEREDPVPSGKIASAAGWDEEAYEEAVSICQFADKVVPEKQQLFQLAYGLVKEVCADIRRDYQEVGLLNFDDLIIKTRNLLRDDLRVRRILKEKFDVLFIDEFQDTDPVQGEIMLFLAEEKTSAAPRWQEVRLAQGKLFVVGDPKQSIYHFRGADITAYEMFTKLILEQGGKKCLLQNNFRSLPEIIDTANEVCSRAMVMQEGFQPAYVPIFTTKTKRPGAVEWLFITGTQEDGFKADDFRHNQAEQIARWIVQHVNQLTLANGEKLSYKHIAVLLRAKTQFSFYISALRRYGVPFRVEGDKDFFRKQEINDFLNFLHAAADPQNRVALAGVLRSPLGGMTDEELFQLAQQDELSITAKTSHPKAQFCYRLLKKYAALAARLNARAWVQSILEETFLPEACALAYDGERTLTHLRGLLKLIPPDEELSVSEVILLFDRLREEVRKDPTALGNAVNEEAADSVSLLSIHKSKGLEFPVVILADLTKQERNTADMRAHIFSWRHNMHGLRVGKICDLNMAFLEEEQHKHGRCEETRVLYVALTRAREKLILAGDTRPRWETGSRPFIEAGLFPTEKDSFVTKKDLKLPVIHFSAQDPKEFCFVQHTTLQPTVPFRGLTKWAQEAQARRQTYEEFCQSASRQSPSEQQAQALLTPAQQQAAVLGSVCHHALELLLTQKQPVLAQAVSQAAVHFSAQERAPEALEILEPFVKSPLFAQVRRARVLACEMPFSFVQKDGTVISGAMDALLEAADGSIWVVDYKTDRISRGQEARVFADKYRVQVEVYVQAARKIFPSKKVRGSVVFLRTFAAVDL